MLNSHSFFYRFKFICYPCIQRVWPRQRWKSFLWGQLLLLFDVMTLIKDARIVHNYTMPSKFSRRKIGTCIHEAKYDAISRSCCKKVKTNTRFGLLSKPPVIHCYSIYWTIASFLFSYTVFRKVPRFGKVDGTVCEIRNSDLLEPCNSAGNIYSCAWTTNFRILTEAKCIHSCNVRVGWGEVLSVRQKSTVSTIAGVKTI